MRVGYVSRLFIKGFGKSYSDALNSLVEESKSENLDILVVSGGISRDYKLSLKFVDDLGKSLKYFNIRLRFVIGNTDLYYRESVVDKEKMVRGILNRYRTDEFYLPSNPILTRSVRIIGCESWYDYTLYRGNPISLKNISKKRFMFFTNDDNKYITDEEDYTVGIENMFDMRYCRECVKSMRIDLENYQRRYGHVSSNVVVMYMKPSKVFLHDSYIDKYMGSFEGSSKFHDVMNEYNVSDCFIGSNSEKSARIDHVMYHTVNPKMEVIEYV